MSYFFTKLSTMVFLLSVGLPSWATGSNPLPTLPPHVENALIVGFDQGTHKNDKTHAFKSLNALKHAKVSPLTEDTELVLLPKGTPLHAAINKLLANPHVRFAEPDYILELDEMPNDPEYTDGSLWNMYSPTSSPAATYGTRAADAWAQGIIGSKDVIVGVIDTGTRLDHPDLADNIWDNPYEIAGNGIDDDGNGYVDDVHGFDFGDNDNDPSPNGSGHGTATAGVIGAVGGNGLGVVGVNWNVSLVPLKISDVNGTMTASRAIEALDYLTNLKILHPDLDIVASNNSYGFGRSYSQAFLDAINRAGDQGIFFVNGAGNNSDNIDITPRYPSVYQCTQTVNGDTRDYDCVLVGAATNSSGFLPSFTNYGAQNVDFGAPGEGIHTTTVAGYSTNASGSSFAGPHIAGTLALCKDAANSVGNPITPKQMRAALLYSANPMTNLQNKIYTGGGLDIGRAITYCMQPDFTSADCTAPAVPTNLTTTMSKSRKDVYLSWNDNSTAEWRFEIQRETYDSKTNSYGDPVIIAQLAANTTSYQDSPDKKTTNRYSVRAFNTNELTGACYSPFSVPSNPVTVR